MALAKENNIDITEAKAQNIFARLNPTNAELSDKELEEFVGGCGGCSHPEWKKIGVYKSNNRSTPNTVYTVLQCTSCNKVIETNGNLWDYNIVNRYDEDVWLSPSERPDHSGGFYLK